MSKDKETEAERKARHRHEEAEDLAPDSTVRDGAGYTRGRAWEDVARMALARRPGDRTEQDWDAIGRHPNPRSGVTGESGWDGHPGS